MGPYSRVLLLNLERLCGHEILSLDKVMHLLLNEIFLVKLKVGKQE